MQRRGGFAVLHLRLGNRDQSPADRERCLAGAHLVHHVVLRGYGGSELSRERALALAYLTGDERACR